MYVFFFLNNTVEFTHRVRNTFAWSVYDGGRNNCGSRATCLYTLLPGGAPSSTSEILQLMGRARGRPCQTFPTGCAPGGVEGCGDEVKMGHRSLRCSPSKQTQHPMSGNSFRSVIIRGSSNTPKEYSASKIKNTT